MLAKITCSLQGVQLVIWKDIIRIISYALIGGWTNPSEKYTRQIGSSPQGSGWKFQKNLKPPPSKRGKCSKQHFQITTAPWRMSFSVTCILGTVQPKVCEGMARLLEISWAQTAMSTHKMAWAFIETLKKTQDHDAHDLPMICSLRKDHQLLRKSYRKKPSIWASVAIKFNVWPTEGLQIFSQFGVSLWEANLTLDAVHETHGAWFEDQLSKLSLETPWKWPKTMQDM